jgi:hypothetical protein
MFKTPGTTRKSKPSGRTPKRRRQARLQVEQLEVRNLPSVYTPAQISAAYGFNQVTFTTTTGQTIQGDGSGQTIAIVDAYGDPNIFSDVNTFDQTFTTTKNGTTGTYYNLYGSSSSFLTVATPQGTPTTDTGWALEITLDVEWAHAIAPGAKILLVEANSTSLTSLLAGVSYAAAQPGVVAVSMSWGSPEFSGENTFDSYFTTPAGHLGGSNGLGGANIAGGITYVAASGDSGAGVCYPAASPNVLSVGGTSLTLSSSGGYGSETAWSGSGGGYSGFEAEPTYQNSVQSTGMRSNPDVAYNADPNNGYWIYDSLGYAGYSGWLQVGGTSAAAPQWAALVAIADQGRAINGHGSLDGATQTLPAIYALPASDFHDITSGSNGYPATTGYDPVTGRGSPIANLVISGLVGPTSTTPTPPSGGSGNGGHHARGHHSGRARFADSGPTPLLTGPVGPRTSSLIVAAPASLPMLSSSLDGSGTATTPQAPTAVVGESRTGGGDDPSPDDNVAAQGPTASSPMPTAAATATAAVPVLPPEEVEWSSALDAGFIDDALSREQWEDFEPAAPLLAGEPGSGSGEALLPATLAVALAGYWRPIPRQKPRHRAPV